jgi:ABC-2 type transport system permease protein
VFGGAFGVIVLANLGSQRAAQQIFPFVLLPQYFLSGLFNPIANLPLPLDILSKISPLRYAVDLTRDAYYSTTDERVQLFDASTNLAIMAAMFVVFMVVGTFLFVRAERNR